MSKPAVGIFVDDSNLFYAQKTAGWKIDIAKLAEALTAEVKISFVKYYLAIPEKWDQTYLGTQKYVSKLKENPHVSVISKPVKYIRSGSSITKKGDVDVEIVLDVVRNLPNLDLILLISGDSDYVELRKYVLEHKKQIVFLGFKHNMAWEIKQGKYILFEKLRDLVELGDKKTPKLSPGRILLPHLYTKTGEKSST